jgi:hypothetical protein
MMVMNPPLRATGILASRKYTGFRSGTTDRKPYITYIRPYPAMNSEHE